MEYNYLPAELPTRVWEAFQSYKGDREVSLLLSVAWSAFVVPTERLDFLQTNHHACDSQSKHCVPASIVKTWNAKKVEIVSDLKKPEGVCTFNNRDSLKPAGSSDWFRCICKDENPNSQPNYAELATVLRHGLSHGNIWTDSKKKAIENLYIANYPPSISKPVKVLRVQECTLYALVEQFVGWYGNCIKTSETKREIASQGMVSEG